PRALMETSRFRPYIGNVKEVKKVDDLTVDVITDGPAPVLVQGLTEIRIMSKAWATKHNVLKPQDFAGKEETYASRNANGTGPYARRTGEAGGRPVAVKHPSGRGKREPSAGAVISPPITRPPTPGGALPPGETAFGLGPPPQDIPRLKQDSHIKIVEGSEN